ncbi:hypothetical protein PRIPAC_93013 [Pristionchus pacificus]|uniref:Uncharacterized protein n=1 Tax=Pristionchus pacificus TaxID=54126 RepID=A0A2A6CIS3_PRIPA|nr:hypothetical protein PRIPAC_93013 [Pristionchus pacificus]|eukprot:PDM77921.1 hypothetical protein PRIPAC_34788 [Pristionchus pacificus]
MTLDRLRGGRRAPSRAREKEEEDSDEEDLIIGPVDRFFRRRRMVVSDEKISAIVGNEEAEEAGGEEECGKFVDTRFAEAIEVWVKQHGVPLPRRAPKLAERRAEASDDTMDERAGREERRDGERMRSRRRYLNPSSATAESDASTLRRCAPLLE